MELHDYAEVMNGIRSFREQELLVDYTIEVEDQEFKVHKLVMASASDYFKAMFTGNMMESQTDRVRLEGLNALAVSETIDFIYKGNLYYCRKARIEDLTECAVYLQIQTAIPHIICAARCKISKDRADCFHLLSMFQKYTVSDGAKMVVKNMIANFDEVFELWEPGKMTYYDVQNLIDVWQYSEWDLFITIKKWVDLDSENRQQHMCSLMSHLRLGLMSPEQLGVIKASDLYLESDCLFRDKLEKALEYHRLPTHRKVLDDSEQTVIRKEPSPFYFREDLKILSKVRDKKLWKACKALDGPEIEYGIETFLVVNNFLIVCDTEQEWYILDPRIMKWSPMAPLVIPRCDFALVFCDNHLYAVGGCLEDDPEQETDVIERYEFETNSWGMMSTKLPRPMEKHGAAAIGSYIYVAEHRLVAGFWEPMFDCYDTSTNTWHRKKTPMYCDTHQRLDVIELYNEKVPYVMSDFEDDGLYILYYSPSKDEWDTWNHDEEEEDYNTPYVPKFSDPHKLFLLNMMDRSIKDKDIKQAPLDRYANWSYSDGKYAVECEIKELHWNNAPTVCHKEEGRDTTFCRLRFLSVPPSSRALLTIP